MKLFDHFMESQRVSIEPYEPRLHEPTGDWFAFRKPRPHSEITEWVGPMATEADCREFCDVANAAMAEFLKTCSKEVLNELKTAPDISVHFAPGDEFGFTWHPSIAPNRWTVTFDGSQSVEQAQATANEIIQSERERLNKVFRIHGR